jgi:hypothetical protein
VIHIQHRGDMVEPVMVCAVCAKPLALKDCWLAFRALEPAHQSSEGQFVHRRCVDGHAKTVLQGERFVMWRGADVLERLLRA